MSQQDKTITFHMKAFNYVNSKRVLTQKKINTKKKQKTNIVKEKKKTSSSRRINVFNMIIFS